jgi:hypothetical protein
MSGPGPQVESFGRPPASLWSFMPPDPSDPSPALALSALLSYALARRLVHPHLAQPVDLCKR